jgi:hypothetical protein
VDKSIVYYFIFHHTQNTHIKNQNILDLISCSHTRALILPDIYFGSDCFSCLIFHSTSFLSVASSRPKNTARVSKNNDDDLWDSIAAPAPKTLSKPLNVKKAGTATGDDDLWNSIAAPAPATRAQPLSASRGRGAKPASQSLGAQRKNRTS